VACEQRGRHYRRRRRRWSASSSQFTAIAQTRTQATQLSMMILLPFVFLSGMPFKKPAA
jgi:hypothetical protein